MSLCPRLTHHFSVVHEAWRVRRCCLMPEGACLVLGLSCANHGISGSVFCGCLACSGMPLRRSVWIRLLGGESVVDVSLDGPLAGETLRLDNESPGCLIFCVLLVCCLAWRWCWVPIRRSARLYASSSFDILRLTRPFSTESEKNKNDARCAVW